MLHHMPAITLPERAFLKTWKRKDSRAELLENVFGVSPDNTTRAVDVAISTLRAKLERDPRDPAIIASVKAAGYVWTAGT